MKVHSAFLDAKTSAILGGWAYGLQVVAMTVEGFYQRSVPRPEKVLLGTIGFCSFMCAWLQAVALQQASAQPSLAERPASKEAAPQELAPQMVATAPPRPVA